MCLAVRFARARVSLRKLCVPCERLHCCAFTPLIAHHRRCRARRGVSVSSTPRTRHVRPHRPHGVAVPASALPVGRAPPSRRIHAPWSPFPPSSPSAVRSRRSVPPPGRQVRRGSGATGRRARHFRSSGLQPGDCAPRAGRGALGSVRGPQLSGRLVLVRTCWCGLCVKSGPGRVTS